MVICAVVGRGSNFQNLLAANAKLCHSLREGKLKNAWVKKFMGKDAYV